MEANLYSDPDKVVLDSRSQIIKHQRFNLVAQLRYNQTVSLPPPAKGTGSFCGKTLLTLNLIAGFDLLEVAAEEF